MSYAPLAFTGANLGSLVLMGLVLWLGGAVLALGRRLLAQRQPAKAVDSSR